MGTSKESEGKNRWEGFEDEEVGNDEQTSSSSEPLNHRCSGRTTAFSTGTAAQPGPADAGHPRRRGGGAIRLSRRESSRYLQSVLLRRTSLNTLSYGTLCARNGRSARFVADDQIMKGLEVV
jgi:hypothetical protein